MSGGWSDDDIARRVAQEFEDGSCVNLGFGLPILIGRHLPQDRTVFLHSENGIIGMGPDATGNDFDPDVVNASKKHVTLVKGAAIVHQADSFSLIRGGRLDYSILGALQVSASGDIANWRVPGAKGVGGVGGAMDLAVGARKVYVMMRQTGKDGRSKLMPECSFPLTGVRCVDKVFTDLGVVDCTDDGFVVRELAEGVSESRMHAAIGGPVRFDLNQATRA